MSKLSNSPSGQRILLFLIFLVAITLTWSCQKKETEKYKPLSRGISLENMDTLADPRQDFYRYVNGKWEDRTEIPSYTGRWGAVDELRQYNRSILKQILDDAIQQNKYATDTDEGKALDFYKTGLDSALAERTGFTPLLPMLQKAEGITDQESLNDALVFLGREAINPIFTNYIWVDDKRSTHYAVFLAQGGMSLPSRDYYLVENKRFQEVRDAFRNYITRVFSLLGEETKASQYADLIWSVETAFAKNSMSPLDMQDPQKNYNKMSLADAARLSQTIDIQAFFDQTGLRGLDTVIVNQVEFFQHLDEVINQFSFADWQIFFKWQIVSGFVPYLNHDFVSAGFEFNRVMQGTTQMPPRWERVMQVSNSFVTVGEGIGKLYVAEMFPPETKAKALDMVNNVISAMRDHIRDLTWMSEETKQKALQKLDRMGTKIGYPDEWRGLNGLSLSNRSYVENIMEVNQYWSEYFKANLNNPINKKYWIMMPQEVNAHYSPNNNEIVFPAGFLQPPFFDAQMDAAVNYGAIGMVIGHEITHGFDNMGSQFDADGNLANWWTEEDRKKFDSLSQQLIAQYNAYILIDTIHLNGAMTLGENIADLGGLSIAFDGLKKHWETHGKPDPADGFTPEQRFFIAWNQGLRSRHRPEELRRLAFVAVHSPQHIRAVGALVNNKDFFEAFNVREGDAMRRPDSLLIKIW